MPKFPTFPTLFDEVLKINISDLKAWGYLNGLHNREGVITWSSNGDEIGKIAISLNTSGKEPYIKLDYKYGDAPRNYKVRLVNIPSNLGKGVVWYFLCPQTKKRCRKLYLIGGYFLHREAFKGCMYESQTKSKYYRQIEKMLNTFYKTDDLYSQIYKKHFKRTYAGRPTKRYLRLKSRIQKAEHTSFRKIEKLFSG